MEFDVSIVSRDTTEPVMPLDAAKRQLDVTFNDDDDLIQTHIDAAVSYVEHYTNRFLQPVTLDFIADNLPNKPFLLPYGPVSAVVSVTIDGAVVGSVRTVPGSQYTVLPPASSRWPVSGAGYGAAILRYTAGYAAGEVPETILGAMYQIISIYYDKPVGNELTSQWDAVHRVLSPLKLRSV